MEVRQLRNGDVVEETRETFIYLLPDGRRAGTKADTEEEARRSVSTTMQVAKELLNLDLSNLDSKVI